MLFAGPFSFTEDITKNTPLITALRYAALSPNFWVPFLTLLFLEWRVQDKFRIVNLHVSALKSYWIGVLASYILSIYIFVVAKHPISGTSVIAFSLLLTYFVLFPYCAFILKRQQVKYKEERVVSAFSASLFGIALVFPWQFKFAYGAHIWTYAFIFILPALYFALYPAINKWVYYIAVNNSDRDVRSLLLFSLLFVLSLVLIQFVVFNKSWFLHLLGFVFYVTAYTLFSYGKINEISKLRKQLDTELI